MDINQKYRAVFYDLYATPKGLFAYTLYSRYDIKPSEAMVFMDKYAKEGIITVDNNQCISLTKKGKETIIHVLNRPISIVQDENNSYLSRIKSDETIKAYEPYLPDISIDDMNKQERVWEEISK